jgi:hypothetical protein
MAKAKAKKEKGKDRAKGGTRAAKPGGERSMVWLQGLLCGALATLATPTAALFAILLLPGLVAVALDRAPSRPVARTMLLCGLAMCVAPVRLLWHDGHTLRIALAVAFDPQTLGLAWIVQAGGWLLSELIPFGVRMVLEAGSLSRAKKLRAERAEHEEEWGLPPLEPKAG